jgi:hypothetical protein
MDGRPRDRKENRPVHADQHSSPQASAQAMFQRVITGWAMDALSLRRRGLDRPSERSGTGLWLTPGPLRVTEERSWSVPAIRWRPRSDIAA